MVLISDLLDKWAEGQERCGLIVRGGRVLEIANSAKEIGLENAHFVMLVENVQSALEAEGLTLKNIVGVWHTHPSGISKPSDFDIAGWPLKNDPDLEYYIVTQHLVTRWKNVGGKPILVARASENLAERIS